MSFICWSRTRIATGVRLARALERLPELVRQHLADLETLLAAKQIDQGKAILAALDTTVTLHPCEAQLEAEITGRPERVLVPSASAGSRQGQLSGLLVAGGGDFGRIPFRAGTRAIWR